MSSKPVSREPYYVRRRLEANEPRLIRALGHVGNTLQAGGHQSKQAIRKARQILKDLKRDWRWQTNDFYDWEAKERAQFLEKLAALSRALKSPAAWQRHSSLRDSLRTIITQARATHQLLSRKEADLDIRPKEFLC